MKEPTQSVHFAPSLFLLAVTAVVLFPSVNDFPVTDCFSLIAKARDLSFVDIFLPSQTAEINPYYRPLFVAVLKVFELIDGPAPELQHLFAIAIHGLGAILLYLFGLRLTQHRLYALAAALLFAINPTCASTVAWTTVCYAVLSGVFSLGVAWAGLALIQTQGLKYLWLGLGFQALGLLASQSAYQCAPMLVWMGLILGLSGFRVARLWLGLILGVAGLTAASYLVLESQLNASTFGRDGLGLVDLVVEFLGNIPTYFGGFFGLGTLEPWTFYPALILAAGLTWWLCGRTGIFALGWALVATCPFALIAEGTERYAYLAAAPTYLWLMTFLQGLHQVQSKIRWVTFAAVIAFGLYLANLTQKELRAWHHLGEDSRLSYQTVLSVRDRYTTPERLHLVNMPSFHRWLLAYGLGISSDDLRETVRNYRNFETEKLRFGPRELTFQDGDLLLWYHDGYLHEAEPGNLPRKTQYPLACLPSSWIQVRGTEAAVRLAVDEFEGDPCDLVVLEVTPPDIPRSLGPGRILSTDHAKMSLQVEMEQRGLLVLTVPYTPLDPLAHHVKQTQQMYRAYHVLLDGDPAKVYPAFYHFVAVEVPLGKHEVQLVRAD